VIYVADEKEELEIMPLYDQVKLDIYNSFLFLTQLRTKILTDRAEGFNPKDLNKYKGNLVAFYGFITTKINYPKGEKYQKLRELSKFITNPENITDQKAEDFYILFAELIERLGITKIGKASMSNPSTAPFEKSEW